MITCAEPNRETFGDYQTALKNAVKPPVGARPCPKWDTRVKGANRPWESFVVFKNADFKKTDIVLEFGAWSSFIGIYYARFVKKIVMSDSFLWARKHLVAAQQNYNDKEWMEEVEKYNIPNVVVRELDIRTTDYPPKTFDKIVSHGAFEHISEDDVALIEMARILKDDGLVSMTTEFKYGDSLPLKGFSRCYNREDITKLIESSPFKFKGEHWKPWWGKPPGWKEKNIYLLALLLEKR